VAVFHLGSPRGSS